MEGDINTKSSELMVRSYSRGSRIPTIDTTPKDVRLPEEEAGNIDPNLFPEGTCNTCQKITLHGLLKTHGSSVEDRLLRYDRDLPTSCPMCRFVIDSISTNFDIGMTGVLSLRMNINGSGPHAERRPRDIDVAQYEGRNSPKSLRIPAELKYKGFDTLGCFRVYAEPGSYSANFIASRAPSSNLSDATFQNIIRWIKDCDETHTTHCGTYLSKFPEASRRYFPTRLIHVGSVTKQPRLYISQKDQSEHYIALSHCWGESPQARTLNGNIQSHKEEIVFERLSRTFQDAIRVTRRLGIKYIWIDSLCIVQDDDNDWLQESDQMGSVYANAYITIAATSAADGSGGLDSTRPLHNWIKFPCDGSDKAKGYMWFTDASWTLQTDLDEAPLNTRGWVLQEKTLSRRILHFASSQVYWQCKECLFGEEHEYDLEINHLDKPLDLSAFWHGIYSTLEVESWQIPYTHPDYARKRWNPCPLVNMFHREWKAFVRYYCTRSFTKTSDRLIALLGISRVLERSTKLRCIDGHWDDGSWYFVRQLMWFPPKEQRTLSVFDGVKQSRLCSSWSWASLEGPIEYLMNSNNTDDWGQYGLKNCDLYLQAIEDKIHDPWPSHPLKVSAMIKTFYKCNKYEGWTTSGKAEGSGIAYGWLRFDREDQEPQTFQFCPLYIKRDQISCLVLVQRHAPERTELCFERVGAGFVQLKFIDLFETCERSSFCII